MKQKKISAFILLSLTPAAVLTACADKPKDYVKNTAYEVTAKSNSFEYSADYGIIAIAER